MQVGAESESEGVIKADSEYIMSTYMRSPVVIVRGRGTRVWDAEGREYLDFVAGISVNNVGHCHPAVVSAICQQAELLLHCSNLYYNKPQVQLAQRLSELTLGGKVFFCQSGAEAVEGAIKLARRYFWRHRKPRAGAADIPRVVTFQGGFHGRTLAALAATGRYTDGFAPLPSGFVQVPFNDPAVASSVIDETTCAVLVEPVQGEGGVRPANPEFLSSLRRACDETGALLIFDEVQTGFGRTGRMFAFEHYGIRPDVITLAKALGGGLPIGAVVATPEVSAAFQPGDHGSTFGGNPVACAAALAALDVVTAEDLPGRARAMGGYFSEKLRALAREYGFVNEVRGLGLLQGMELNFACRQLVDECRIHGLLVNATSQCVLRFLPPLIVTAEEIDRSVEILDTVFQAVSQREPLELSG